MRADLMAELGLSCTGLGVALQWARSFGLPAWAAATLGVLLAGGLWAAGFDWSAAKDVQASIVHSLPIIGAFASSLLGGVLGTEKVAEFAVANWKANPDHILVPVTK